MIVYRISVRTVREESNSRRKNRLTVRTEAPLSSAHSALGTFKSMRRLSPADHFERLSLVNQSFREKLDHEAKIITMGQSGLN